MQRDTFPQGVTRINRAALCILPARMVYCTHKPMLDEQKTTIAKLKQAYELSAQEAESLLCALSPDSVFPFILWQKVC